MAVRWRLLYIAARAMISHMVEPSDKDIEIARLRERIHQIERGIVTRPGQVGAAEIPPPWIRATATFLENYYNEDPSHSEQVAARLFDEIFQRCRAGRYSGA